MADQVERIITKITDALTQRSTEGGTQKLTITDNHVVGTSQACRSCLIHAPTTNSGNIHLTIAGEIADANDFLIPDGQVIPIPIDNVSDLHFYGTVNGDKIYILWRD